MKNVIKILSLSIFSLVFITGALFAQENQEVVKTKKSCGGGCCSEISDSNSMDHSAMKKLMSADKNNDGKVFECPMKCEAPKDEAGECSECGMKLKEVSISYHKMNMKNKSHKMMNHSKAEKGDAGNEPSKIDKNNDGKLYLCPMKCEAPQDTPGDCSECGMHLKEISMEQIKSSVFTNNMD